MFLVFGGGGRGIRIPSLPLTWQLEGAWKTKILLQGTPMNPL